MSAPKSGPQSPPPSAQEPVQGAAAPSTEKASDTNAQAGTRVTKSDSELQLDALPSNPTGSGIDKKPAISISKEGCVLPIRVWKAPKRMEDGDECSVSRYHDLSNHNVH